MAILTSLKLVSGTNGSPALLLKLLFGQKWYKIHVLKKSIIQKKKKKLSRNQSCKYVILENN
jgi:hypothetical protein